MKLDLGAIKQAKAGAGFGNRSDYRFDARGQTGWQPAEVIFADETTSKGGNPMIIIDLGHPPLEGEHVGKRTRMYLLTQKALWKLHGFLKAACADLLDQEGEVEMDPTMFVGRKLDVDLQWDEGSADYEPKLNAVKMAPPGSQCAPVAAGSGSTPENNNDEEEWF